jgi:thioredoxin-related protein
MLNFRNPSLQKTLETVANLALIGCCVIFAVVLVKNYLLKETAPKPQPAASLIGKKLDLENVDWTRTEKNLVLVLSKNCRFCDESAPFYQRLVKETAGSNTRLISVFPHSETEDRQYLKDKMIEIAEVKQVVPHRLGVKGTPTLLLVNNEGTVVEEWVGKLPSDAQETVIARLKR